MLAFDDRGLEARHDFIQWLFPLPERSRAIPWAPVMSASDLEALKASEVARERLARAARLMLGFYGRNAHWRRRQEHNHLRITRIIRSLRLILGDDAADSFRAEIETLAADAPIDPAAHRYWAQA